MLVKPPATIPRLATAALAPRLAALSTAVAYTPPWTMPLGVWCSGPSPMWPTTRLAVAASTSSP
jgi:hypothetical protein